MDDRLFYIKMCEKAKKIQEEWKPKDGDIVWHPNEGVEEFGCVEFPAEEGIVILCDAHNIEWWRNWLWLPRQDQLQNMIEFPTIRVMLNHIRAFSYDIRGRNFKSMEQLWLAFVMKEKYNKIWNEKEWI